MDQPLTDPASSEDIQWLLAGEEDRALLALFKRKDDEATAERRWLFLMLGLINWLVLCIALLSGLILAQGSLDKLSQGLSDTGILAWLGPALRWGTDGLVRALPTITVMVALISIATTVLGRLTRDADRLGRWQRLRAEAEIARGDRFKALARAAVARGPAATGAALALVERDLLKHQRDWYLARAERHDDSGRITLWWSGLAVVLSALASAAAFTVWGDPAKGGLLILGVLAAAFAAFAADREHLQRDRSNAELYRTTADRLTQLAARLDLVRVALLEGHPEVVIAFTDTVADELAAEHRQWSNGLAVTAELLSRLDQRIQQARAPAAAQSPDAPSLPTVAKGAIRAITEGGAAAVQAGLGGVIEEASQLAAKLARWTPLLSAAAEALPPPLGDRAQALLVEANRTADLLAKGSDGASELATSLLGRLRDDNPIGGWFAATAPKLAGLVGTAVPPLGLLLTLVGVGAELGSLAYRRWVTRVLEAPFAPQQLEIAPVDSTAILAALEVLPIFGTAFAPERELGDLAFFNGLVPGLAGDADDLWPRMQGRFGDDRARFDAGLREFNKALLGSASEPDLAIIAAQAGTTPPALRDGLAALRAEPEGNAALQVAVQLADGIRRAGMADPAAALAAASQGRDP